METATTQSKLAIIVQQGKVLNFIDGKTQRQETLEEYVRQEIAKSLVREYGYAKSSIEVEFVLRIGTRRPRADLIIFPPAANHVQKRALIIVECKVSSVKSADKKDGVGQLQSYMAAYPNVSYGMGRTGSSAFATAVPSRMARSILRMFLIFRSSGVKMRKKTVRTSTSSSLPPRMHYSLLSAAATITSQETKVCRSHRHSGNCSN